MRGIGGGKNPCSAALGALAGIRDGRPPRSPEQIGRPRTFWERWGWNEMTDQADATVRASSLWELLDCAYRWHEKQDKRLPASVPIAIGNAVHASTGAYDQARVESDGVLSVDDAAGVAVDMLSHPTEEVDWGRAEFSHAEAERRALWCHTRYCHEIAPTRTYLAVEEALEPLVVRLSSGTTLELTGHVDRRRVVYGPKGEMWQGVSDIKGLALGTPIPTPPGWTTMRDVAVDDIVFDAHGDRCKVIAKSERKRIGTYIVRFDDTSEIICDREHIWWTSPGRRPKKPVSSSICDIIDTLRSHRGQAHHRIPVALPLQLPDALLPIDPYLLGCWLGDGHARDGGITKEDALFKIIESDGHQLGVRQKQVAGKEHIATRTVKGLAEKLRDCSLTHNKHIPNKYLRASITQRTRLLQGLMDTDGTWNTARQRASFTSVDWRLAHQVKELIHTLGCQAHIATINCRGFGKDVTRYDIEFTPVGIEPFRLPRKAKLARAMRKNITKAMRRVIVSVETGPDVYTACIAVDSPTNTYLCGLEMIPTHNTGARAVNADGSAKLGRHGPQLGVYQLLAEHSLNMRMHLEPEIIGLATGGKALAGVASVPNALKALIGTEGQPGFLDFVGEYIRSGLYHANPGSILCSPRYCPVWPECPYHD